MVSGDLSFGFAAHRVPNFANVIWVNENQCLRGGLSPALCQFRWYATPVPVSFFFFLLQSGFAVNDYLFFAFPFCSIALWLRVL